MGPPFHQYALSLGPRVNLVRSGAGLRFYFCPGYVYASIPSNSSRRALCSGWWLVSERFLLSVHPPSSGFGLPSAPMPGWY